MPPGNTAVAAGTVNVSVVQSPAVAITEGELFQLAQLLDCMNNCVQTLVVPAGTHTCAVIVAPGHILEVPGGGVMAIVLTDEVAALPASSAAWLVRAGSVALSDCVPVSF